jgi:predicted Zn finger-like uncharacterized protein
MKITCQACAAKYTIADEKVVGKTVKIRCKKCGANIIVNAGEASGAATGPATADAPQRLEGGGQGSSDAVWTVNVAEGDQRTMSLADIVSEYGSHVVTDDTFCWKDGMGDWLPVREIPELYGACARGAAGAGHEEEDAATRIHEAPAAILAMVGNGAGAAAVPAARRAGARAPGADLFGNAAQAGGEDDVLTSAPAGAPERHDEGKAIGERNENSVLFSLGALTAPALGTPAENRTTATNEASGLIDIRQLSAQLNAGDEKKKKQSRVDDIMNLGGGAFSPGLSAPVLSAPALEEFASSPDGAAAGGTATAGKSRGMIIGALAGGLLLIGGVVGVAMMMTQGKTDEKTKTAASGSAVGTEASAAAAGPSAAPSAPIAAAAPSSPPEPSSAPSAAASDTSAGATKTPPTAAPTETHATTKEPTPEKTAAPATPAAESAGPFDMGEAKSKLAAIAGAVQACKRGDASGTGRVIVTFATNGAAQSATVSGAPFEGTPTGACVASKFRGARVPAFSGAPFTVSKSFTIN